MASECIGGVPDCTFWFDSRQQTYAKTDEIITRHLRLHQILEMRRYSENLERIFELLAKALAPTYIVRSADSERVVDAKPGEAIHLTPEQHIERTTTPDGRCISCGFPVASTRHLERPCGQKQEILT